MLLLRCAIKDLVLGVGVSCGGGGGHSSWSGHRPWPLLSTVEVLVLLVGGGKVPTGLLGMS